MKLKRIKKMLLGATLLTLANSTYAQSATGYECSVIDYSHPGGPLTTAFTYDNLGGYFRTAIGRVVISLYLSPEKVLSIRLARDYAFDRIPEPKFQTYSYAEGYDFPRRLGAILVTNDAGIPLAAFVDCTKAEKGTP